VNRKKGGKNMKILPFDDMQTALSALLADDRDYILVKHELKAGDERDGGFR
jgi:hypothetical protein